MISIRIKQDREYMSDFDEEVQKLLQDKDKNKNK